MNRRILKLAIPNIISNISVPLLNLIDLGLIGHLESEQYIGAVSVGGVIFNLIYWSFVFLRMSSSGFTAQAYGERNLKETAYILIRGLTVALAGNVIILIFQGFVAYAGLLMVDASSEVESLAREYFFIRIYSAPATIALFVIFGWFTGMQNSKSPMIITIILNIFNIGLDYAFIKYFDLRSNGVAWGSLCAQYLGLFFSLWIIYRYYGKIFRNIKFRDAFELKKMKNFFMVNKDIFIRTVCVLVVFTVFTSRSASQNDIVLATNALLLQFLMFFSYLMDGFAFAAEALTGKYYGAKDYSNLKKSVGYIFRWAIGIAVVFTLTYLLLGDLFVRVLTNNDKIIEYAYEYIIWIALIPLASFASFTWDGVYIGMTASKEMRNTMILSSLFVFLPIIVFFKAWIGNHALWLAMNLFMISRAVSQTILFPKVCKRILAGSPQ